MASQRLGKYTVEIRKLKVLPSEGQVRGQKIKIQIAKVLSR